MPSVLWRKIRSSHGSASFTEMLNTPKGFVPWFPPIFWQKIFFTPEAQTGRRNIIWLRWRILSHKSTILHIHTLEEMSWYGCEKCILVLFTMKEPLTKSNDNLIKLSLNRGQSIHLCSGHGLATHNYQNINKMDKAEQKILHMYLQFDDLTLTWINELAKWLMKRFNL